MSCALSASVKKRPEQVSGRFFLRTKSKLQQESIVVINADEAVNHGRVVTVMDELREIEGSTLGIATQQPSAGEGME
jgi:biopolymer transport protein ExbD